MGKDDKIVQDAPFEIPPFDEKEYIRKELISFKTTLILFGVALVASLISWAVYRSQGHQISFLMQLLIAFAIALPLKFLFKALKVDISHWGRKQWFGTYAMFFLFWIGFFLLLSNPPIGDESGPKVDVIVSPHVQSVGHPIAFAAFIADNADLKEDRTVFCVLHVPNGSAPAWYSDLTAEQRAQCGPEWNRVSGNKPHWNYTVAAAQPGVYAYYIVAEDTSGKKEEARGTVRVGSPFAGVERPRDAKFVTSTDQFKVKLDPAVKDYARGVQFTLDGTNWTFFERDESQRADDSSWFFDAIWPQFRAGEEVDVRIRVIEQPQFLHLGHMLEGGIAPDPGGPYHLTVDALFGTAGSGEAPDFDEDRYVPPGATPGFEAAFALLAVLGLFVVLRRRSRHA